MKRFLVLIAIFSLKSTMVFPQKPTGNWLCTTEYGSVSLKFLSDSQMEYDGDVLSYKVSGNTLQVMTDWGWTDYPFELNGDQLIITYPEGYRLLFNKVKTPARTGSGGNAGTASAGGMYLTGTLCEYGSSSSYSSYSSYSHTSRLYFDGQGNFQYGTEQSYGGDAGIAYSDGNDVSTGTYRINGNSVQLTFSDGSAYTLQIHFVQDDGRITELKFGEKLFATALCD